MFPLKIAGLLALCCGFGVVVSVSSHYTCEPLSYRIGVKINCEHPVTRESINCKTEKVPTGTTAFYKCEDYYVSNNGDGDEGGQIKCNNNGEWTPRNSLHGFSCRIDCGKPGEITKWPWHATIFHRNSEQDSFRYSCGGTLINPSNKGFVIFTVSNCFPEASTVNAANIRVALGLTNTEYVRNVDSNYARVYSVNKISTNVRNELTLLSLDKDVILDETVLPACFNAHSPIEPKHDGSVSAQLIGFERGRVQDLLRKISLNQKTCRSSSSKKSANFCMGLSSKSAADGVCSGDIGGGLFSPVTTNGCVQKPTRYTIQGVLTDLEAEVYDDCSRSGIFTYVTNYTQWISEQAEKFNSEDNAVVNSLPEQTTVRLSFHRETVAPAPNRRTPTTPTYIVPPTTLRPLTSSYRPIISKPPSHHGHPTRAPEVIAPTTPSQRPTATTETLSKNPSDFQQVGLDWHNFYRRKHGVSKVTLSDRLNEEAQWEAEQWINNHRFEFTGVTNWFASTRANLDSSQAAKEAIKDWYRTLGGYNWTQPTSLPFTHIIWKSTSQIGIGVVRKGEDQIVVAKYLRPIYFQHEHDQAFQENLLPPINNRK